jgi:cytochrome P450
MLSPKQVPPGGDHLGGHFVPGGTKIGVVQWSIGRNKALFGDDVEVYRPERWLGADEARRTEMERVTEMIFGYGRWVCAGKAIAFMELSKVIFEVCSILLSLLKLPERDSLTTFAGQMVREFDIQVVNPKSPWGSQKQYLLFIVKDMWLRFSERAK